MTDIKNVLIVGGGIAGLTAATALAQQGVSCEVVELHDLPVGAAITIQNQAVEGLRQIGVLEQFLNEGVPKSSQEFFTYFDAAGEQLPTPPLPPSAAPDLPQAIVIHRVAMSRILRQAAESAGVPVRVKTSIERLVEDENSVTATFTDGSQNSYDLVLGADGIRSHTRQLVFGDIVTPKYSGTTMFRWVVPDMPDFGPGGFHQAERLIVLVRLRDGSVYLATGRHYPEKPGRIPPEQARQAVREHLELFTAPVMAEIHKRLTDDVQIVVNDYDWLLVPQPWHRGRVVLLGDAAHATTAMMASGGGMAIEDALVLADEVASGGQVDEVLQRYTARRFERVRLVVEVSVELDAMLKRGDPVPAQNALRGQAIRTLLTPF